MNERTYLALVGREAVDLFLEVLYLGLLVLIRSHLLRKICFADIVLIIHGANTALQGLLVLLALGQLDLYVPETLLELFDLSHGHSELLHGLGNGLLAATN